MTHIVIYVEDTEIRYKTFHDLYSAEDFVRYFKQDNSNILLYLIEGKILKDLDK